MDFSVEALEYDRFKQLLEPYVKSPEGRELLRRFEPTTNRNVLETQHAVNREAMGYLREHGVDFAEIPLLADALGQLNVSGITLTVEEIEAVTTLLSEVGALQTRWSGESENFPLLAERSRAFPDLEWLRSLLLRAVQGGEIREDYSPRLKGLRREAGKARDRLRRKLESILKSEKFSAQLQEELVTIRNGRYVIPVRIEQKRNVQGIVHGVSSSGATVFMEPLETLEMNNDIVRLEEEEAQEVRRILQELTESIQASTPDLEEAVRLRAQLDALFGIAQFGRDFDCVTPEFSDGALRLVGGRHPLLEARLRSKTEAGVVPLTLAMGAEERTLVLSGPNAGGKTVVLKTVGLLCLMAQSGMPVPAEVAEVPIFDHALADIGDRQSIVSQLSTFSAHVLAVSRMVEIATNRSLILLDEVGGSTEPGEGAALGVAILDHFRRLGAFTLVTTHYNRIKMYAETTDGVRNAAMEFNESTLEPTYRLIDGLAGQSSGLRIAERFRMPSALIERARQALDRAELDAARYVQELKSRISSLEREKKTLEAERQSFQQWTSAMRTRMEDERREELARMEQRLDAIVVEMRNAAASQLEAAGRAAEERFSRSLKRVRERAGAEMRRMQQEAGGDEEPDGTSSAQPPVPGSRVRIVSLGVEGIVSQVLDTEAEITIGSMKTRCPYDDLQVVEAPLSGLKSVRLELAEKHLDSNEIKLIGYTRDEALSLLDKFLDDAFLAHLPEVRIIHGFGTGALRRGVWELLRSHPHVASFESAPQNQGGEGATLATLKQ